MKKTKLIFLSLITLFSVISLYLLYGGVMSYIQWGKQPTLRLVGGDTTTISFGFSVQGNIYFSLMGASLLITIALVVIYFILKNKHQKSSN